MLLQICNAMTRLHLRIIFGFSTALGLTFISGWACTPMESAKAMRAQAASGHATFQSLLNEYGGHDEDPEDPYNPGNNNDDTDPTDDIGDNEDPESPSISIGIKANVARLCHMGEWDIVQTAKECGVNLSLIATVLDAKGETLLRKLALTDTLDNMMSALALDHLTTVSGDEINIFVCIDSNANSRCVDEPLLDINYITNEIQAGRKAQLCGSLAKGLLIYHRYHVFGGGLSQAGTAAQSVLNNLTEPAYMNGAVTMFPLTLVKAKAASECPQMTLRTNGCFVKGTRIALAEHMSAPIEALNAGMEVLRADGQRARITRIVAGPEAKPVLRFTLTSGETVRVTREHPMATRAGLKPAHTVGIGDELAVQGGKFQSLREIRQEAYAGQVYNIELEGGARDADHMVIADRVITGDLYIQNKLTLNPAISPHWLSVLERGER